MYKGTDRVLKAIIGGPMEIGAIAKETSLNEDSVRRIVEDLRVQGYLSVEVAESVRGVPTEELARYAAGTFPEISAYSKARKGALVRDLAPDERSIGIRWGRAKGFFIIENGRLVPEKGEPEVAAEGRRLAEGFRQITEKGRCEDIELMEELFERRLITRKAERQSTVRYSGKKVDWTLFEDRFEFNVPGPDSPLGKNHPITKMTKRISSIMAELGFEEMEGDIIESSFWNFDALFQPQDHPARELADTFYLDKSMPLPDDEGLVARVKKAHEEGWKYEWDPDEASRAVLRTHTTCLSARHLASLRDRKPKKFFAIGRVFRNEATDYKHLAEFHQVEGIIAWENATFTDLLGVLREFYGKLGFEKIRFRPSFFPYTEPSLEIEVYYEPRKQWLELGGAGMFRPEVSIPLAGVYPVLAWGLSLERPLMLMLELEDIRALYRNDADFLSKARLDI